MASPASSPNLVVAQPSRSTRRHEVAHVLRDHASGLRLTKEQAHYLSRYVHRIAISNSRITAYDGKNVTFRYQDRADGNATKYPTVTGPEFAKLFLQHVLPTRFVRIRHFGILAVRRRGDLDRCRELLHAPPPPPRQKDATWVETYQRLFGSNPLRCPNCKVGILVVTRVLPPMRT